MELQVYISWAHFYTHVFIILKSQQKNGLNSHKNISPSFFFFKVNETTRYYMYITRTQYMEQSSIVTTHLSVHVWNDKRI